MAEKCGRGIFGPENQKPNVLRHLDFFERKTLGRYFCAKNPGAYFSAHKIGAGPIFRPRKSERGLFFGPENRRRRYFSAQKIGGGGIFRPRKSTLEKERENKKTA